MTSLLVQLYVGHIIKCHAGIPCHMEIGIVQVVYPRKVIHRSDWVVKEPLMKPQSWAELEITHSLL